MRNFWQRANRGLLLGAVLVLGTTVYVGIDYFRFSHGKDDMEQVLKSYTAELSQAAVTPQNQAIYQYERTDADKEAIYKALGDVVRTYWTDTHDKSADYYYLKNNALFDMHALAYDLEEPGYVTGYTANVSKIKLSKNGPGAAKFSMDVDYVIDTYGYCSFPTLAYLEDSYYSAVDGYEDNDSTDIYMEGGVILSVSGEEEAVVDKDEDIDYYEGALRTTATVTYNGELLYEDGSWKISWMDYEWYGVNFHTEPQEGGN